MHEAQASSSASRSIGRKKFIAILFLGALAIALSLVLYQQSMTWVAEAEAKVKAAQHAADQAQGKPVHISNSSTADKPRIDAGSNLIAQATQMAEGGKLYPALLLAERAVRGNPSDANSQLFLGKVYAPLGYLREAEGCYRKAIKLSPTLLEAYQRLGDLLTSEGKAKDADETFTQALSHAAGAPGPYLSLGQLQLQQNQNSKVLETLAPVLTSSNPPVAALYMAGKACQLLGRTTEAEKYLQQAIQAQPEFPDAHHALGSILANTGRYASGIEALRKAVSLQPDNPTYHYALGNAIRSNAVQAEGFMEARGEFEATLELDPSMTIAHYYYGLMLEKTGEIEAAVREYEITLRQAPEFHAAGYRLGFVYRTLGKEDLSKRYLEKYGSKVKSMVTEVHGKRRDNSFIDDAASQIDRAKRFMAQGDTAKAVSALEAALQRDPSNGIARRLLNEARLKGQGR